MIPLSIRQINMSTRILKNRIWIILLVLAALSHSVEFATGDGYPQYRVFDAEKIDSIVDTRDGNRYKILAMRKKVSISQDSVKIVEFRMYIQPNRFKTAHSKDTLGITFYGKDDMPNACPNGWHVLSGAASGSVQYIQDSLFIGSLASSFLLDDNSEPLIKYSEHGFFAIHESDTVFVSGFNRIWVEDMGLVHPSAYVNEIKLLNKQYSAAFLDNISQYPLDNTREYLLTASCMWSSDSLITPVFQSAVPFGHDGFIPVKKW